MRQRFLLAAALLGALAAAPLAASGPPADWPCFRGPHGDGISAETGLATRWPEGGPKVLWKVPLGGGFSGLSAVDGRLYTMVGRGGQELVAALAANDGRELWSAAIDRERQDRFGDGPRATPAVDGGRVFAVSALGQLHALAAADGATLWSRDLRRDFGAVVPQWGISASPLVDGGLLLFNVAGKKGHAVVAFRADSGEVAWAGGTDVPGYSTPISLTVGGLRQAIFFSGSQVLALAPASGEVLWTRPWKTAYDVNAAMPIFIAPDKLFFSSGYDTGAALLRLRVGKGAVAVDELWTSRGMKNQFSSSVYHDGHIYGFDNKNLKCIDAADGRDKWRKSGLGHGTLFYADGHLVVLGEGGRLALLEATPAGYTEVASHQVAEGKHWTVPTLYGGRLYVRDERQLTCLQVGG